MAVTPKLKRPKRSSEAHGERRADAKKVVAEVAGDFEAPCGRCGESWPEEQLVIHEAGQLCPGCEAHVDGRDNQRRQLITGIGSSMLLGVGSAAWIYWGVWASHQTGILMNDMAFAYITQPIIALVLLYQLVRGYQGYGDAEDREALWSLHLAFRISALIGMATALGVLWPLYQVILLYGPTV